MVVYVGNNYDIGCGNGHRFQIQSGAGSRRFVGGFGEWLFMSDQRLLLDESSYKRQISMIYDSCDCRVCYLLGIEEM